MKIVGSGLIFLVGFILGAALFHTRAVSAQGTTIYVQRARSGNLGTLVEGSSIVGFSCAGDDCYIASR